MSHAEKLGLIYDELVRLRDTMGKSSGHEGYVPWATTVCSATANEGGRRELPKGRREAHRPPGRRRLPPPGRAPGQGLTP